MMASLASDLIWMRSMFVTLVPVGRDRAPIVAGQ